VYLNVQVEKTLRYVTCGLRVYNHASCAFWLFAKNRPMSIFLTLFGLEKAQRKLYRDSIALYMTKIELIFECKGSMKESDGRKNTNIC